MTKIALNLNLNPGSVDIVVNLKKVDGSYHRLTAFVDTGGEISLFPKQLLDFIEHEVVVLEEIEQAGIARQTISALKAKVKLYFEDIQGNESPEIEVVAWFAETKYELIGFENILDCAILFDDYLDTRTGWLELR